MLLACHQLCEMRIDFIENDIDCLQIHFVELLLQEPTAVLVLAHGIDLANYLINARVAPSYI